MLTYILGPFLSLVPERWRNALFGGMPIFWPRAAAISGFVESFGCVLALAFWYLHYATLVTRESAGTLVGADVLPGGTATIGMGVVSLMAFLVHPFTWVLIAFAVEGVVRCLAAMINEQTYGTFPLAAIAHLVASARQRAYLRRVPLVVDQVRRGGGKQPWDLRVESCRPKPGWKHPKTIVYESDFYRVEGEAAAAGSPARPHVYLLKFVPGGEAYRGFEEYSPQDILRVTEKSASVFGDIFASLRDAYRLKRLPLVADTVTRSDGKEGWHLKVESCRPKPEWTFPRTICFEDQLYRVEAGYPASPPRPFGFRLLKLPDNEAARGILAYSPDEPIKQSGK